MSENTKCPQCGNNIYYEFNTPLVCNLCGWGKQESVVLAEPTGWLYKFGNKSTRWKAGAIAVVFIALLVITPLARYSRNQILANHAVAVAKSQMDKRLYASAVRTLNQAPRSQTSDATRKQMNAILSDTVRWAHDISDVKSAKKDIVASNPDSALNTLDNVDEDFPQQNESDDLVDFAQDEAIDPNLEVSDQIVDDIAYVPDDPEAGNLPELTNEAEEQLSPPTASTPPANPVGTTPATTPEEPPIDDPTAPDPEEPILPEELPETPEDTPDTVGQLSAAPHLSNLYQLDWANRSSQPTDKDSFYTMNLNKEVTPKKDAKSNFGGYGAGTVIGQLYSRKPAGNRNIVALYRYWNDKKTDHYYTINGKFSANAASAGYNRQGVTGYIGKWDGSKCLDGTKPLYNLYNAKLTDNRYTVDAAQKDALTKTPGWVFTKVAGCIW